jgi:hypothetical protein
MSNKALGHISMVVLFGGDCGGRHAMTGLIAMSRIQFLYRFRCLCGGWFAGCLFFKIIPWKKQREFQNFLRLAALPMMHKTVPEVANVNIQLL